MKRAKAWALPAVTGLVVLSALLLPPQISALRDRQTLGTIHKELLAQEELTIREATLAEKVTLLVRATRYPDLDVYSTTQSLPAPGEPDAAQSEELFFQSVDFLLAWGVLPQDFDRDSLEYQGGSRAVYVQSDGSLSAGILYLQGRTAGRDDLWLVVDQETGLPCGSTAPCAPSGIRFRPVQFWASGFWTGWGWRRSCAATPCGS